MLSLGNKAKNLPLLAVALAVLAVVAAFFFFNKSQVEKKIRLQKEQQLNTTLTSLSQTQAKIGKVQKEKAYLEEQLNANIATLETTVKEYDKKITALNSEMKVLNEANGLLRKQITAKEKEIEELKGSMQGWHSERSHLVKRVKRLEEEKQNFAREASRRDVPETLEVDATPELEAMDLTDAEPVALGDIIVKQTTGQNVQVLHVNGVYDFVVISAGKRDGMQRQEVVNVVRNNRLVAKASIEKLRDNVAAAIVLPGYTAYDIKEGDQIGRAV